MKWRKRRLKKTVLILCSQFLYRIDVFLHIVVRCESYSANITDSCPCFGCWYHWKLARQVWELLCSILHIFGRCNSNRIHGSAEVLEPHQEYKHMESVALHCCRGGWMWNQMYVCLLCSFLFRTNKFCIFLLLLGIERSYMPNYLMSIYIVEECKCLKLVGQFIVFVVPTF